MSEEEKKAFYRGVVAAISAKTKELAKGEEKNKK